MFACNAGAPLRRNGDGAIAALAAVFVLGSAAAATGLSSSPTELATNSIGCYDAAGNVVCRRMPSCAGRDGSAGIRRCWAVAPAAPCRRSTAAATGASRSAAALRSEARSRIGGNVTFRSTRPQAGVEYTDAAASGSSSSFSRWRGDRTRARRWPSAR
jgi:hypothetical protein